MKQTRNLEDLLESRCDLLAARRQDAAVGCLQRFPPGGTATSLSARATASSGKYHNHNGGGKSRLRPGETVSGWTSLHPN